MKTSTIGLGVSGVVAVGVVALFVKNRIPDPFVIPCTPGDWYCRGVAGTELWECSPTGDEWLVTPGGCGVS